MVSRRYWSRLRHAEAPRWPPEEIADRRMNILFVSRCMPTPMTSGDRVLLHSLARELAARGHRLDLLAFYLDGETVDREEAGKVFADVEAVKERTRSPLDYLIRLRHPFPDSAAQCWNGAMWKAIHHRLASGRYDVVHFFGGVQVYEFRNLVAARLPTIIVPYDCYSLFLERAIAAKSGVVERIRLRAALAMARRYEAFAYAGFGAVVLVTEVDAAYLRSLAPDLPTAVIPNGVDAGFFRPVDDVERPPSLVFVGNMAYAPNVAAAVALVTQILPNVEAEVPGAHATVIGPQPPPELSSLNGANVEITGWVPDIRPHLAGAACFLSPLTTGTGIRNKILEAMAAGVPVAATPLSCEGIRVKDGEDILLGRDPAELAAAAIRLLRDKHLWHRIAEGGQRLVRRNHSWSQIADRYEALYEAVAPEWRLEHGATG